MKTLTQWLRGLGATVALTVGAAAQVAPGPGEVPGNAAAAAELERFQVATQLRATRPTLTPEQEARVVTAFLEHLRTRNAVAAEKLRAGRMDREELDARLGVFLRENPALLQSAASARPADDPRVRVIELLRETRSLTLTDREREALADQFIERLREANRVAHDALMSGRLSPEELRSRLTLYLNDLTAATATPQADPRDATLEALIDKHVRDHHGNPQERLRSFAFRGSVTDGPRTLDFVVMKKRPGLLRMLILDQGTVIRSIGHDGEIAWTQAPGEPAVRAIGTAEADIAEMARFDSPLVGYRERGAEVHREDQPGTGPIVIRVREKTGAETVSVLDPETLVEVAQRTTSAAGEPVETRFSDHRKVGVANLPHVHERWVAGKLRATNRITQIVPEPGLLDSVFRRPAPAELTYMDYQGALRRVLEQQRRTAGKEGAK
jgi:hypothetical protein